jgi:hypothetical protein
LKKLDNNIYEFKVIDKHSPICLTRLTVPFPDELLSSWILRCAKLYNLKSHVFAKFVWGKTQIWTRDIDKSIKKEDLEIFAKINNVPYEIAYNSTLNFYVGKLFDKININGQTKYINTTGVYHRNRKYYALYYCPICLENINYYKRIWRISIIIVCPKCNIYLKDNCENCNSPILPHRIYMTKKNSYNLSLSTCYNCKKPLYETTIVHASEGMKKMTKTVMQKLGDTPDQSISYFKLLYFFIRIITFNRTIANYLNEMKITHIPDFSKKYRKHTFEVLTLIEKENVLLGCYYLMKQWPFNFKKCIQMCGINYSDLVIERSHKNELPDQVKMILRKC